MSADFNPNNVDLDTVDPTAVICYLELGENEYNGKLGA
jgi:zinc transporter 1/2/3